MRTLLMHTLGGKPAYYYEGEQICFAGKTGRRPVKLCTTLAQIKAEQRASEKWRKSKGFDSFLENGYVHISVP